MNQAALAWAAFRNMLRVAARDPLWALVSLLSAPFRFGRTIFQVGIFYFVVVIVFAFILEYAMRSLSIARGDMLWYVGNTAFTAFVLRFLFRLITNPLINHFGDPDGETHGSARFATDKETAALTRADSGLLIGRDPKSAKLLRYDGPAHLLTMAPTRTGKKANGSKAQKLKSVGRYRALRTKRSRYSSRVISLAT